MRTNLVEENGDSSKSSRKKFANGTFMSFQELNQFQIVVRQYLEKDHYLISPLILHQQHVVKNDNLERQNVDNTINLLEPTIIKINKQIQVNQRQDRQRQDRQQQNLTNVKEQQSKKLENMMIKIKQKQKVIINTNLKYLQLDKKQLKFSNKKYQIKSDYCLKSAIQIFKMIQMFINQKQNSQIQYVKKKLNQYSYNKKTQSNKQLNKDSQSLKDKAMQKRNNVQKEYQRKKQKPKKKKQKKRYNYILYFTSNIFFSYISFFTFYKYHLFYFIKMSTYRNMQMLQKYKSLTLQQLYTAIYGQKAHLKPQTEFWNAYVINRQVKLKQQLKQNYQHKKVIDEEKISRDKYDVLIRMHQKSKHNHKVQQKNK